MFIFENKLSERNIYDLECKSRVGIINGYREERSFTLIECLGAVSRQAKVILFNKTIVESTVFHQAQARKWLDIFLLDVS